MARSVGWATLQVVPSLRGIDSNISRQLNTGASTAGQRAGNAYGQEFHRSYAGWVQRIAVLTAGIGIGKGLSAITTAGVKGAANLETLTTAFTSLLGSSKAANEQIQQLQKFAAATPFSQSDVFGYAQQYFALANSIGLAKDQVQPFLQTIGNIAAVTGASSENIHNAVLAIGQIGSAGKVTLDNLNQISEAFPGFSGAAAIASATGQTSAQVMKEISSGAIDAKTGVQALLLGMQKFPGAANAMAKQSRTLSGLFSTFKDNISINLTKAFEPLVPTIKQQLSALLPVVTQALDAFAPVLVSFANDLVPLLQPLIGGLSQSFGAIFGALGPVLRALAPVIQPLTKAFVHLVQALQPLFVLLAQVVAQLGPPLLAIFTDLANAIAPVVQELAKALAPVLPIIAQALQQVAVALRPVLGALSQAFVQVIQAIAPELPGLAKAFGDLAVALARMIVPLTPLIGLWANLMSHLSGPVLKAITFIVDKVAELVGKLADMEHLIEQIVGGEVIAGTGRLSATLQAESDAITQAKQAQALGGTLGALGAGAAAGGALGKAGGKATGGGFSFKPGSVPGAAGPKLPDFDRSTLASFLQTALGTQANPLTAALNAILKSASDAGKKISADMIARLRSENGTLNTLSKDRAKIADTLSKATDEIASVRDTVKGTFNIATAGADSFGRVTFGNISNDIRTAVTNARQFVNVLKKLAREGLNRLLIGQLAEAGPAALPQALALASATPKQLAALNGEFKNLSSLGTQTGNIAASAMFGAGRVSAEGFIKGLRSKESALTKAIKALAEKMVAQLKSSLQIHSPSRVMFGLGEYTGEGFARGIASKYSAVALASDRLANGALPRSQMATWTGRTDQRGSTPTPPVKPPQHYHIHGITDPEAFTMAVARRQARRVV